MPCELGALLIIILLYILFVYKINKYVMDEELNKGKSDVS